MNKLSVYALQLEIAVCLIEQRASGIGTGVEENERWICVNEQLPVQKTGSTWSWGLCLKPAPLAD